MATRELNELLSKRRSKFLEIYTKSENSLYHCRLCFVECCHHVGIVGYKYACISCLESFANFLAYLCFFLFLLFAATLYV